jgi:hypothetical protein
MTTPQLLTPDPNSYSVSHGDFLGAVTYFVIRNDAQRTIVSRRFATREEAKLALENLNYAGWSRNDR